MGLKYTLYPSRELLITNENMVIAAIKGIADITFNTSCKATEEKHINVIQE